MKSCRICGGKYRARQMCYFHYMQWYRSHRQEAAREITPKQRKWKFTAKHWEAWLEDRQLDIRTLELRDAIQAMRRTLP